MNVYRPEGADSSAFRGYRLERLEDALRKGEILEASAIKADNNLTLHINLGNGLVGKIPYEEFEYSVDGSKAKSVAVVSRVAKATCFKVKSIKGKEIILSRKMAQQECFDEYIRKLKLGQVIDVRVTHTEDYGAFCDIGCGIIGLLPVENFCISRIKNPKKTLRKFTSLKAVVRGIDKNNRLTLSHRELLGTWEQEAAKFSEGDVIAGVVRYVEEYGIFVELTPNLAGLAEHIDGVEAGDIVSVFIKSIRPEKMKIKLLIVDKGSKNCSHTQLDYRLPEGGFVKHWVYSPAGSTKLVETVIVDEAEQADAKDEQADAKDEQD